MSRTSWIRKRPAGEAMPQTDVVQSDQVAHEGGGFSALLKSAEQEVLAVTYWFDPAPHMEPYPVTVRFSGHRIDVKGRLRAGDRFTQDETIEEVVCGSGPISLTARVRDINPGEWAVTARMQGPAHPRREQKEQEGKALAPEPLDPVARFWRRWAPSVASAKPVRTCLPPFVRVPGLFPGIWGIMVALGLAAALALQFLVVSADHLAIGAAWMISLIAIVVGIVCAKGWYLALYRREHLINGWCIQGFITGATLTAAILLVVLKVPAGAFLDATAPGLLVAMAVGRVGCFFAGCCGGPPTASRWGVWSSNQRVGARRVPTQLLELVLAGILGILVLVAVLARGPAGGAYFVGALAAYTLLRQGILHLRAEPRKTRLGMPVTVTLAAVVLIASVIFLVR